MLIIKTSSYLLVTILVLYFNDYDIHVNTLFKAVKDGFTVKVKKLFLFKCRTQLMLRALLLD